VIREKALVKKDSSSYTLPKASLIKSRAIIFIGTGKIERKEIVDSLRMGVLMALFKQHPRLSWRPKEDEQKSVS
jgi:hypothetical protein